MKGSEALALASTDGLSQHPVVRICQHSAEAGSAMYPDDTCHVTPMLTSGDDISLSSETQMASESELATCPGRRRSNGRHCVKNIAKIRGERER